MTAPPMAAQPAAPLALETRGLTKAFSGYVAVNNVNLRVRQGSLHALIGANGAGKTTCFNLLTKFIAPSAGTLWLNGQDITAQNPQALARRGMVRSFQISSIFPSMTVLENVRLGLQRQSGVSMLFWRHERWLRRLNDQAMAALDVVGLQALADRRAGDLPYGRKRALELAATLAMQPEVLLLDEPTQGMGHEDVARVTQLIQQVAVGRTVLMVEHNMSVVAGICDHITVLQRGEILAEGTYQAVSANPLVREAYLGQAHGAGTT